MEKHAQSSQVHDPQIKLNLECYVKPPKFYVADQEASPNQYDQPYYLGPIDLIFLPFDHMQKGLLFSTKPEPQLLQSYLDNLTSSLSLSLAHFYPLAGQLATQKFPDEHASLIYVDPNKGPGARLIHASAVELTVSDILSPTDLPRIVESFFDMGEKAVNHDGHTRPLLSVHVTELLDGIFIGFTMNHSVADGTSLWHFISTLSEIFEKRHANANSISRKPIFKPDGYGSTIKLPYLESDEFIARFERGPLRERMFHFSPSSVSKLKARANQECGVGYLSSFQALSGLLWRSITRARNLDPDLETYCILPVNCRTRIEPPLSQDNFGNMVAVAQASWKVGELLDRGLGWAAMLLYRSVVAQDDKALRGFFNKYVEGSFVVEAGRDFSYNKPNSVFIGGSPRFDKYGPEFGLGKAVAVLGGYASKVDGKVTADPGREGGGSVDLEVCLEPDTMNALELDEEFMSFVSSSSI